MHWLIEHQEADGSWFGRWGVNHVYGTGAVVPGLIAAGVDPSRACIRRAVRWLERHQNEDGGWGEDPRSYDDPEWIGRGPSTASQTAWALLALHAAGERSRALARGVAWLVSTQRADGGWDEPQYTGTGFPCDYYINYHLYRLTFPIMALGRCLATDGQRDTIGGRHRRATGVMLTADAPIDAPAAEAVMARAGTENFPVASRVLPRRVRSHLLAVYGFARLVDELGDSDARPPGERLLALDWLEEQLDLAFAGEAEHPLLVRLQATVRECALAREPFVRLIEANRVDQRVGRYQTWEQLRRLLRAVGRSGGRARARRLRRRHARADRAVELDLHGAAADRALPGRAPRTSPAVGSTCRLEDLRRFGCADADLAADHASEPLREVLAFEVARARGLLADGAPLIGSLRGRPRLAVAAFVAGGRAALDAIERARYDVLAGPPRAGRARRALALAATLRASRSGGVVSAAAAIADAYRHCEAVTRRQAANFFYGIRLLPRRPAPRDVRGIRVRPPRRRHRRRDARAGGEAAAPRRRGAGARSDRAVRRRRSTARIP